ncbi:MAG: ribosome biogenesis GTPase Der [Candidatus Lambdaproteobacteria bacterium]|nr:ribosome biogenesis GTPase Der [Candidatus Lambdaproteobacteria bacterium]
MGDGAAMALVALVGRPNVGKSTLFNRITATRQALMAPMPGLTRDRREGVAQQRGFRFRVVDTGGLTFREGVPFAGAVAAQVEIAVDRAALVLFLVDAVEGLTARDEEIYRWLRRKGRPVLVLSNKADNARRAEAGAEFFALGVERVFPVSATHGTGLAEVLEEAALLAPELREAEPGEAPPEGAAIRVAFFGRPNVGKSTLVNRILGEERMIVSEIPGTTREAIDVACRRGGQEYLLIDTAGIRRRARTTEHVEKIGVLSSLSSLDRVDVAVLVLDAPGGVAEQDARLASYILDHQRALVIALNKWDDVRERGAAGKEIEATIRHTLRFVDYAARVRTSGQTGFGLGKLFDAIQGAYRQYSRTLQTAELNRSLAGWIAGHPPPARGHRHATKVFYGAQIGTRPPRFRFFVNHPEQIGDAYTRYIANQLREAYGFRGTPLRVEWQGRRETGPSARRRPA